MNQHGEILRDLFLSEDYIIDDSTLKLKTNYDEIFNQHSTSISKDKFIENFYNYKI